MQLNYNFTKVSMMGLDHTSVHNDRKEMKIDMADEKKGIRDIFRPIEEFMLIYGPQVEEMINRAVKKIDEMEVTMNQKKLALEERYRKELEIEYGKLEALKFDLEIGARRLDAEEERLSRIQNTQKDILDDIITLKDEKERLVNEILDLAKLKSQVERGIFEEEDIVPLLESLL